MLKIRVVKTGSSARAVQVVRYKNNKRIIVKHFGSAHEEAQLTELIEVANEWIKDFTGQLSFFTDDNPNTVLHLNHCTFLGVYHTFFYDIISDLQFQIGFSDFNQPILADLVIIRLFEPASKLRSIELLEYYFGIKHLRKNYYKLAPNWLKLKMEVESKVIEFAKRNYDFTYDLLFYDVTTLYFETFEDDELRKAGFSKDGKAQQPQILVALLVSKEGFPIGYEIFAGNTFEGHTIMPVIESFIKKHKVKQFTVVADAAMISKSNVEELQKHKINYIVGARLGNLPLDVIDVIDKSLSRLDGRSIRLKTANGYLICSYSALRYRKDKHEMKKQVDKAKLIIEKPSKKKKVKFTTTNNEKLELNKDLIKKSIKLLGIKGYYTDLEEKIVPNQMIIERYHELYKIEQNFRVAKSDLQTRPIFHFKEEPIKLHILICFMALVISKHVELKTQVSIRKFVTECKKMTDARMLNKITNKEVRIRTEISPIVKAFLAKLSPPH